MIYDIVQQLNAIPATSQDFLLHNNAAVRKKMMKDITDGHVCNRLIDTKLGPFITLTMNVDGVQVNTGSDQSL